MSAEEAERLLELHRMQQQQQEEEEEEDEMAGEGKCMSKTFRHSGKKVPTVHKSQNPVWHHPIEAHFTLAIAFLYKKILLAIVFP